VVINDFNQFQVILPRFTVFSVSWKEEGKTISNKEQGIMNREVEQKNSAYSIAESCI